MSGDEKRQGRARPSQRPIEAPVLRDGSLRAFKVTLYNLYLDAGQPRLDDVVAEIRGLAVTLAGSLFPGGEGGEDGEARVDEVLGAPAVGKDLVRAIISGDGLPGSEDDAVAVAVALAQLAGRLREGSHTRELVPLVSQVRRLWRAAKIPPPISWATQPLVSDSTDLDARVLKAASPIAYIRRDVEDQARQLLSAGRPVLLIGPAMVGKTRLAVELIRDLFADRQLFVPDSRNALTALLAESPPVIGCVVFLDDFDEVISTPGLSQQALRRLTAGNTVVATMRDRQYDSYQPTSALRPPEWNLLSEFERLFLDRRLSGTEERLVWQAVEEPAVRQRIRDTGIGEYVGAADRIIEAMRLAPSVKPLGHAVIQGCADWARAGALAAVPSRLLRALADPHLTARQRARLTGRDHDEALAWATRDINPTVSLLQPEAGDRYSVFSFALDLISGRGEPIPDSTWPIVVDNAETDDLLEIARHADAAQRPQVSEEALRRCESRGEPDTAPLAAMFLGAALSERGELAEAKDAYHRAINSEHPDARPAALINLAVLLEREGLLDDARHAYRQAIKSNHPTLWPQAALGLGRLSVTQGDLRMAEAAFRRLIDHPINIERTKAKVREQARAEFGNIEVAFIDVRERKAKPEVFLQAELSLADVLERNGDPRGAEQIYRSLQSADAGNVSTVATLNLGVLLLSQGEDLTEAQSCFERVLAGATGQEAAKARFNLAMVHYKQGDRAAAEDGCIEAMDMGVTEVSVGAAFYLMMFRRQRGDAEGTHEALERLVKYASREGGESQLNRLMQRWDARVKDVPSES